MSMKRCFELPVSPSLSLLSRAVLVGSVLSFAAACARKDAAKSDSASATTDSAAMASVTTATPSSPVESVSTGETTVSAESKANPTVAAASVSSGTANTAATPASAATAPAHHTVHHTDSSTTKRDATAPASAKSTSATRAASADTGQKAAADTSKKTAAAGGAGDHLVVSPQEYEGWKMFSVYCYRCHGVDAMGGGIAPNLRHSVSSEGSVTHDVFITTVTNGRLDKGMPTWKALLTPEQMEDLWLYVNARSSGRLAPGRPHMASGANP
ncbi:MAG: cytochrome c, class [Gemmatimonadetes bacterium]|nr:cytochrome c, class [Gemmatimonadota bacterium]